MLRVKKVGNIGERAINTIVVRYDMLDTLLALKGKGIGRRRPKTLKSMDDTLRLWVRPIEFSAGAVGMCSRYGSRIRACPSLSGHHVDTSSVPVRERRH
ncbi:hypothetical protein D7Y33_19510 [Stenotrophomonas maltophilia]|uniref:Uncharacterized protein n=1 Tax=Stenotrophomonas maltophilia TaxID=40324 RepID=A0AAW3S852_STEMA|nr:hypothetical protein [Stenotrophomonas maltophilia]